MGLLARLLAATRSPLVRAPAPPLGVALHHEQLRDSIRKPDRRWPERVTAIESDYQYQFAYQTIAAMVQSVTVTVAAPAESGAQRLADILTTLWQRMLPHALRAIAYGAAAFEKIFDQDEAGLIIYRALDYLPYEQTDMALAPDGGFGGITLRGKGRDPITLPPAKAWWFALDPTPLEPHGRSRYAGAPETVFTSRQELARQERVWYGRHAIGQIVARCPEPDASAVADEAQWPRTQMAAALEAVRSGGVLILSSEQYRGVDNSLSGTYHYDFSHSDGLRDATPLTGRRDSLDKQVLRSMGIPERAVTQDEATGSYGMAEAHKTVLFATCDGILEQIANSFQKYVVRPISLLNFAEPIAAQFQLQWTALREQAMGDGAAAPGEAVAADTTNVATTAINGDQITSLVEVITQVSKGLIPLASARPILEAAFPLLDPKTVERIIKPLKGFTPAPAEAALAAAPDARQLAVDPNSDHDGTGVGRPGGGRGQRGVERNPGGAGRSRPTRPRSALTRRWRAGCN